MPPPAMPPPAQATSSLDEFKRRQQLRKVTKQLNDEIEQQFTPSKAARPSPGGASAPIRSPKRERAIEVRKQPYSSPSKKIDE